MRLLTFKWLENMRMKLPGIVAVSRKTPSFLQHSDPKNFSKIYY